MFASADYKRGFQIDHVASCNFSRLEKVSNDEILKRARKGKSTESNEKLLKFVTERMGIQNRYFVPPTLDALDLARDALKTLIARDPSILEEAEFFIFGGISNAMPTVCHASLLADEFGFKKTSCWDLKSGCSTGVLGVVQALEWFQHKTKRGVVVCSETFSKFTHPEMLQMAASVGDGASAISLRASESWKIRGVVHGTDSAYMKSMYVPGKYPIQINSYMPGDYVFHFEDKPDTLKKMAEYWVGSLQELLKTSGVAGSAVTHYFSHQVDEKKNREIAKACGITDPAISMNFKDFGNMGCPTIFLNYAEWKSRKPAAFKKGDIQIFHAVGGGLSWAGICLEML